MFSSSSRIIALSTWTTLHLATSLSVITLLGLNQSSWAEQSPKLEYWQPANPEIPDHVELGLLAQNLSAHAVKTVRFFQIIRITTRTLQRSTDEISVFPLPPIDDIFANIRTSLAKIKETLLSEIPGAIDALLSTFDMAYIQTTKIFNLDTITPQIILITDVLWFLAGAIAPKGICTLVAEISPFPLNINLCSTIILSLLFINCLWYGISPNITTNRPWCSFVHQLIESITDRPVAPTKLDFNFHPNLTNIQSLSDRFQYDISVLHFDLDRLRKYLEGHQLRLAQDKVAAVQKPEFFRGWWQPTIERGYTSKSHQWLLQRQLSALLRLKRAVDGSIILWQGMKMWGDDLAALIKFDGDYSIVIKTDQTGRGLKRERFLGEYGHNLTLAEKANKILLGHCQKLISEHQPLLLEECFLGIGLWKGIDASVTSTKSITIDTDLTSRPSKQPPNVKYPSPVIKINPIGTHMTPDQDFETLDRSRQRTSLEELISDEICKYLNNLCNHLQSMTETRGNVLQKSREDQSGDSTEEKRNGKEEQQNEEAWEDTTDLFCGWAKHSCFSSKIKPKDEI